MVPSAATQCNPTAPLSRYSTISRSVQINVSVPSIALLPAVRLRTTTAQARRLGNGHAFLSMTPVASARAYLLPTLVELELNGRDVPTSLRGRLNPPIRWLPYKQYENHEMGYQQPGHYHCRDKICSPKVANANPLTT